MYDQSMYIWASVLVAVICMMGSTSILLYRGALAAGLDRVAATVAAGVAAAALGAWLVITGYLAGSMLYRSEERTLWFSLAFAGVLVALLLSTRIPLLDRILSDPGAPSRLALPQTFRVAGGVFLILMAQGNLPAAFALPAGLGDIAIGIAAPFVALRLAREPHHPGAMNAAVRFNLLGILDLVIAVSVGTLLGPPWNLGGAPSTEMLRLLPTALIPTAAVPLAIALHIASLRQLGAAINQGEVSSRTVRRGRGITTATGS